IEPGWTGAFRKVSVGANDRVVTRTYRIPQNQGRRNGRRAASAAVSRGNARRRRNVTGRFMVSAARGRPRDARLALFVEGVIGRDDRLHEGMADDVALVEDDEPDALDPGKDLVCFPQARRLALRQVDLGDVSRYDGLRSEYAESLKH